MIESNDQARYTCIHPNCDAEIHSSRHTCGRHWHHLTPALRKALVATTKGSPENMRVVRAEVVDFFRARMIGDLSICFCRHCGADIVFLETARGHTLPVDREGVRPGDKQFDYKRHQRHKDTCKDFESDRA